MNNQIIDTIISKICHDIISPVGAIHNGLEILNEIGAEPDVIDLINHSASKASAKLKAFRIAYGEAGNDEMLKPEDVYDVVNGLIDQDGKITQDWNPKDQAWFDTERGAGFCKLLLCTLMLGIDSLPRGGTIQAIRTGKGFTVVATGEGAKLRPEAEEIFDTKHIDATLQTNQVHAAMIVMQCERFGVDVCIDQSENALTVTCT